VSPPLTKALVASVPPLWLAALIDLGAGTGLLAVLAPRRLLRPGEPVALPTGADRRRQTSAPGW
jgi:hypothetical protein